MNQKKFARLSLFLLAFLGQNIVRADVVLPNIFQKNMVLQQQTTVNVWGWANPGERVTVTTSWDSEQLTTTTLGDATFKLSLKTPKAGGPHTLTVKGDNKIVLENVMIGEVWLCTGQSNMEWNIKLGELDAKAELPACQNTQIRLFRMPKTTADAPQNDCRGSWLECDSASLRNFSSVGYFFGKKLHQNLNVPVGLIDLSWGGSWIESWIPTDLVNLYPDTKISAEKMSVWAGWPSRAGVIFNGEVAPLSNFALRGVIWYQGESNRHYPSTYYKLMHTMVQSWRGLWQRDLPFYYAQIAPFNYKDSTNLKAALVREAQTRAMDIPQSGMVVTTDLVDNLNDIHPKYKREVGNRLANWALAETYGQKVGNYKSPQYQGFTIEKNKIIVQFKYAESGLMTKNGSEPTEFFIAGADKVFYKAQARIAGSRMEISSEKVAQPVAVRFAFGDMPQPNVFNTEGLPMIPFRTDDW